MNDKQKDYNGRLLEQATDTIKAIYQYHQLPPNSASLPNHVIHAFNANKITSVLDQVRYSMKINNDLLAENNELQRQILAELKKR